MSNAKTLLVDTIYEQLKERIIKGSYPPGIHLVEADLTQEFSVSRVTVREAFRRLAMDELVVAIPNKGVKVRQIDAGGFRDLQEVRALLEGLAAKLVAERTDIKLTALISIYEQERLLMEQSNWSVEESAQRAELNHQFHLAVAALSGNGVLITTHERLLTHVYIFEYQFLRTTPRRMFFGSINDHKKILQAIQAHDGEKAYTLARAHVLEGTKFSELFFR